MDTVQAVPSGMSEPCLFARVTRENVEEVADWVGAEEYWGSTAPEPAVFLQELGDHPVRVGEWAGRTLDGHQAWAAADAVRV